MIDPKLQRHGSVKHPSFFLNTDNKLDNIGVWITNKVGTMWCAILFALLSCVSLPAAIKSHNLIIIIGWITQTFLQLVLLAIILVGSNYADAKREAKALADHIALTHIATNVDKLLLLAEHKDVQ